MLKKFSIFTVLVLLLMLTACGDGKKQSQGEPIPIFIEMSQKDTTEVLDLTKQYLGYLTDGRIDDALAMIKVIDGDSIKDVPDELRKKQESSLKMLHPIRYEIDYYIFRFEDDCVLKYSGILFDKEEGDPNPNKVAYYLKPVRRDNQWYLTLADSEDINTINSEIQN
jgi:hypothetical protein